MLTRITEALPHSFPTWPQDTFTCGSTFYWGGSPVARLSTFEGGCAALFVLPDGSDHLALFPVEQGFDNPAVTTLAAAYNVLRNGSISL